jgi:archaellum component FlaG (FlaF/FlaG flagellin family)
MQSERRIRTYLGGKPVSVEKVSVRPELGQPASGPARIVRRRRVASAVAVGAIAAGLLIGTTACGAGQTSQTANQASAVNGNSATVGPLALRDVAIVFPESGDVAFANGGPLEMSFLISNTSPDVADSLEGIEFANGSGRVTIDGSTDIPATKSLRAGQPGLLLTTSAEPEDPSEERISVTINGAGKTITPGLSVPLIFDFEKAGEVTLNVPVDAGPLLPRQDHPRGAVEAEGEGH